MPVVAVADLLQGTPTSDSRFNLGGSMLEDITPSHLRCVAGYCVAVYKTDDGDFVIIGKKPGAEISKQIEGKVGPDEEVIVISPDYFVNQSAGNI
jgi:hypothetical protein